MIAERLMTNIQSSDIFDTETQNVRILFSSGISGNLDWSYMSDLPNVT